MLERIFEQVGALWYLCRQSVMGCFSAVMIQLGLLGD